ncbi:MAG: hypothetical protein RJB39_117 [Candidatus Parcubacteria bacterium]|jgi:prolyl-tRNA synthetase
MKPYGFIPVIICGNMTCMKHTEIFTKTRKEFPADEVAKNAQLLIKAGFVHKEMAGVYAYLPMGLRVIEKIKKIVRDEMNAYGGQEMIMTSLQKKETWLKTDRWSDENVDVWFKSQLKNGTEVGFGWSHEEPITEMMKNFIHSYKDLPIYTYQFQTKLRNELRAKSGIMRGREFVMKDLYSYTQSQEEHEAFYNRMIEAYMNVYRECGVGEDTFLTVATGGAFTKNVSHEFQTICEAGEDIVFIDRAKKVAYNKEIFDDAAEVERLGLVKEKLEEIKTAEVGNIFSFGPTKSEQMELFFTDVDGKNKPVILGSYGIGITRLMGVVADKYGDDKGLVWPKNIAPYHIEVVSLHKEEDDAVYKAAAAAYASLSGKYDVLFDDRKMSPGSKMFDADLYGCPVQVIIGSKGLEKGIAEVKIRQTGEVKEVELGNISAHVDNIWNSVK